MSDLSAYQNFSVKLNFVTSEITISDTGTYLAGIANNISGKLTILQPDGVTIVGTFADIVYSAGSLQPCSKTLRLDSAGNPQNGTYTVSYEIDHPSYTPSTVSKTFILSYTRKTLDLDEQFDVFTPSLFYRDLTSFAQSGFTTTTNTVAWSAILALVGTVTGTSSSFDLAYLSNYYDAEYAITYQRNLLYTHQTYTYLTVQDRYSDSISTTADTPPAVNDLIECIDDLKVTLDDAGTNCTVVDPLEEKYKKAVVRFDHLIHRLLVGEMDDNLTLLTEIMDLTACEDGVSRGSIIAPYDLSSYTISGGGLNLFYDYDLTADVTEVTLAAMNGKTIHGIKLDGISRRWANGLDGDTVPTGRFIVVTSSTPRKFKYGDTLYNNQWLQIEYT